MQKFLFLKSACPHPANLELLYLQPGYRVYTCRHYERKLGMLAAHPSRHAVRAGRLNLTNPIGQKSNSSHIGLRSLFFFRNQRRPCRRPFFCQSRRYRHPSVAAETSALPHLAAIKQSSSRLVRNSTRVRIARANSPLPRFDYYAFFDIINSP